MKSVRLEDLRELLESATFAAWWSDWQRAAAALRDARQRHEDLLSQSELMALRSEIAQRTAVDTFSRSGEVEDEGTRFTAEAQVHENRALALVGEFEEQRTRASDLWARLGGADDERLRRALEEEYGAADRRRAKLWDEVEAAWAESFERSLVGAEHGVAARRVRRDAERLFKEAEERRARARQLAAEADVAQRELREADAAVETLRAGTRDRFGCVAGRTFLYWRHPDDKRSAFAVALVAEPEGSNVPVAALGIYVVGRQRGVALLEPARAGAGPTPVERDRKLEDLIGGRNP
ncbi:MAG TPA: hypothetical protein VF875_08855 [Anaeromyxobacter sp.]